MKMQAMKKYGQEQRGVAPNRQRYYNEKTQVRGKEAEGP